MRNSRITIKVILIALTLNFAGACNHEPEIKIDHSFDNVKGTYFSVFQFVQDQYRTFRGQPYTFEKVVVMDGKKDSSTVNIYTADLGSVIMPFVNSDIGDRKYLGHYQFNMFEDPTTQTRNFFYEAKDKNLFTRRLQIAADPTTNKVMSIYVETAKKDTWGECTEKLYYQPLRYIQVQRHEKKRFGSDKDIRIEYKFL